MQTLSGSIIGTARGPSNSNLIYVGLVFLTLVLTLASTTETTWENLVAPGAGLFGVTAYLGIKWKIGF